MMIRCPDILLLSDDPVRIRGWTKILARHARIWHAAAEVPPDVLPEVVVTDRAVGCENDLQHEALRHAWQAADIGIVAIGEGLTPDLRLAADVRLSADFHPRELQLACPLLAEAVRWRREYHRARQLQQTFSQLALTDALTGLPNRRAWEEELRQRAARNDSDRRSICLALFDVDHFKSINDGFGHIAGDEVLCHIARSLARSRRTSDYVARLGGDEFAVLLEELDPDASAGVIESLRTCACHGAPHTSVTACAGFACARTPPPGGWSGLLESADAALRVAKLSGRNRTVSA